MKAAAYLTLLVAIMFEVTGTTALKFSNGMTRLVPALVVACGYTVSFWLLSVTLKQMPVGLAYAIWCGLGIIGAKAAGMIFFSESLSTGSVVGTLLIIAGVATLTLTGPGGH